MGAISETEPGGEMVCIVGFEARPRDDDDRPIAGRRRTFSIGERVRYVRHFFIDQPEDNPVGPMAVFEALDPDDKKSYGATQAYFVSLECWEGLKSYFASDLVAMA
jgi:hypothetical protein